MECTVPGTNMKVFAKALQSLAKVGDELYIEAKNDYFSIVSLNSTKTICARFQFHDTFFSSYEVNQDDLKATRNGTISCKIHLKIFLPLFRGNLEKKLDFFKLDYTTDSEVILFKMKYKCDEIVMVHKLHLMDTERLSIGVLADGCCNNLGASSSFYSQLLTMFGSTDEELTFEMNSAKVVARNYCIGSPCCPKKIRTQINLNPTEFLFYCIKKETTVNFSLKPLRTIVSFAETFEQDLQFNFEIGGKPLSLVIKNPTFEVNFIVATLDPYTDSSTTVATTTPIAHKADLTHEDFEALQAENWENDDMTSKESSFAELVKECDKVVQKSPESPRSKKIKTVFGRCVDRTFHPTVLGDVMVADSDTE